MKSVTIKRKVEEMRIDSRYDLTLEDLYTIGRNLFDKRLSNKSRGRYDVYLGVRLPSPLLSKIQELSRETGNSVSDLVRLSLINFLISTGKIDPETARKRRLVITSVTLTEDVKGLLRYLGITKSVKRVVKASRRQTVLFAHLVDGTVADIDLDKRLVVLRRGSTTLEEFMIPPEVEIEVEG